jgi:hypothetical protein
MSVDRQIMGEPPTKNDVYLAALKAWCIYYVKTEDYDRSICHYINREDVAIPVTAAERRASSAYARKMREELSHRLSGVEPMISLQAKYEALGLTYKGQKNLLERITHYA